MEGYGNLLLPRLGMDNVAIGGGAYLVERSGGFTQHYEMVESGL